MIGSVGDSTLPDRRRVLALSLASLASLIALVILSLASGAVRIPLADIADVLVNAVCDARGDAGRHALVVLHIRLPRACLALLIGAALGLSGAIMQGLFRNPLADPGLIGVSAGAALGAGLAIVLGGHLAGLVPGAALTLILPLGAFAGGLASTLLVYCLATRQGRTTIATILLAGIALGALSGALSGFLAFLSDDRQLRDLSFWALGSLGGASWAKVAVVAPAVAALIIISPFLAKGLNGIVLGEAEAFYLGLPVQRVKFTAIVMVALAVGASVAMAGAIGFIGIVVPHLVRLVLGANHQILLPASAIGGAILLLAADILARLIVPPAELPIGILTAAIGAPFFLWLLFGRQRGMIE